MTSYSRFYFMNINDWFDTIITSHSWKKEGTPPIVCMYLFLLLYNMMHKLTFVVIYLPIAYLIKSIYLLWIRNKSDQLLYNGILYLIIKVVKLLSNIPTHEIAQAANIRTAGFTFSLQTLVLPRIGTWLHLLLLYLFLNNCSSPKRYTSFLSMIYAYKSCQTNYIINTYSKHPFSLFP